MSSSRSVELEEHASDHHDTHHLHRRDPISREEEANEPSELAKAIIPTHPKNLMLFWISGLIKFSLSIVVLVVAINTFVALGDVQELEKYDDASADKLTAFMIGVSLLHLGTAVVMVVGSVAGIVASLYPGSTSGTPDAPSSVVQLAAQRESVGAAVLRADQNQDNPIYVERSLKVANIRFYCSIAWFVASILALILQSIRIVLGAIGIKVMHLMIERYKNMPELDVTTDMIILAATAVLTFVLCGPFVVCSFILMLRVYKLKNALSHQLGRIRDSVHM